MAPKRAEPFHLALTSLRDLLQRGEVGPGGRVAAAEVAQQLRLSPTPVREALSQLAGEGLLEERRGEGFFVRRLGPTDVADLYRLSLAHLILALDVRSRPHAPQAETAFEAAAADGSQDWIASSEQVLLNLVTEGGGRALQRSFRQLQAQLGPVRRLEPLIFQDLPRETLEIGRLQGAPEQHRGARMRLYFGRRVRAANRLAELLEARAERRPL